MYSAAQYVRPSEGVQPSLPPRLESTECSGARTSPLTTAMRKSCAVGRSGSALAEHTHRQVSAATNAPTVAKAEECVV
jgi:hypothetical protein